MRPHRKRLSACVCAYTVQYLMYVSKCFSIQLLLIQSPSRQIQYENPTQIQSEEHPVDLIDIGIHNERTK